MPALSAVLLSGAWMELSGWLCEAWVGNKGYLSISSGVVRKAGLTAVPRCPAVTAAAGPNISNLCSLVSSRVPPLSLRSRARKRPARGGRGLRQRVTPGAGLPPLCSFPRLLSVDAFFTLSVFSHFLGKSIQWGQGWAGLYLDICKRCISHLE